MALTAMSLDGSDEETIYYIKNKDAVLGSFRWRTPELAELVEDNGLPKFVTDRLNSWLSSRTPPKHREHIMDLLQSLGLSDTKSIIDFSKGLSLNDTLWVTSQPDIQWATISLFKNPFNDVIAKTAFEGGLRGMGFSTTSPEFGTDGMLAKCWVRGEDGVIRLYKSGSSGASNAGNEPYSEVLAHQVLNCLGYNHIPYRLARYHSKLVSICDLFTNERVAYKPIYQWHSFDSLEGLLSKCKQVDMEKALARMLIFDYLVWNTDRHAGNFGVLLDADTFELQGMAPIFDNGCALLTYWNGRESIDKYTSRAIPALYNSFEYGAQLGKIVLGRDHSVEKLIGFKFDASAVPGFPEERLRVIESWLQDRVQSFLAMKV